MEEAGSGGTQSVNSKDGVKLPSPNMNVENIANECGDELEEHIEAEQEQVDILSEVFFERDTFYQVSSNQQFGNWRSFSFGLSSSYDSLDVALLPILLELMIMCFGFIFPSWHPQKL